MNYRDFLQKVIYAIINPLIKAMIAVGITPNIVTFVGFLGNIVAAGFFLDAAWMLGTEQADYASCMVTVGWGGFIILAAGLFDMMDGRLARMSGKSSLFGALWDSTLDRYSELVSLFGICLIFVRMQGDMIWFWVDASQFTCDITMDFKIDGRSPAVNEPYYTAQAGQTAELAGKLTRAWDGANYARVPIAAGYTGWIGLPFTSFNRSPVTAKSIEVHFGYSDNDAAKGKTLYIDALTLTDDATGPDGITIPQKDPVDTRPATPDKAAWNMENIPDDLLTATWASARYGSHADYTPDNVQILGIDGKGRNNTRALAIRQNGGYCWADEFDIDLTMDNTFCNDWSSGDMLMLWVDATEFAGTQLTLELFINDNKPANDTSYFLEEDGRLVKAGTLPDAWGGSAGWGRLPVTPGFKGWSCGSAQCLRQRQDGGNHQAPCRLL